MSDEGFEDNDVCMTCGEEWCTCDEAMEELEPMEMGNMVKKQSTIGVSFKFFTIDEFKEKYYGRELE
jgi:hypothetical protein